MWRRRPQHGGRLFGRQPAREPAGQALLLRDRFLRTGAAVLTGAAIAGAAVGWALWPAPAPSPVVSRFTFALPEDQLQECIRRSHTLVAAGLPKKTRVAIGLGD